MRRKLPEFLKLESASAIFLFIAAILSFICANSFLAEYHYSFKLRFLFLINEGLMAIFFLTITLELKRNYLNGLLSGAAVKLPAVAALGGMIVPALIYCFFNYQSPDTLRGWSTPVATDVAFALGVLSLFGRRVPISLKLFLLALAIFDDLGAILIIAFFYSQGVSVLFLTLSLLLIAFLYWLQLENSRPLWIYLLVGAFLWCALQQSGIHPTIAGVILGLFIPSHPRSAKSLLLRLEKFLHPIVSFFIIPVFAFANAGFVLKDINLESLTDSVVLGIVFGLFIGKQIGVFGFSWALIKWKRAKLPDKTTWLQFYSIAILCGIGFTMSLFLGTLSFQNEHTYLVEVRLGVLIGSLLSGLSAALILMTTLSKASRSIR